MANNARTVTPKAKVYRLYGDKARYDVESVLEDVPSTGTMRLITPPKQCRYRCRLCLPEVYNRRPVEVTSGTFTKKKDAEQDAARIALEQLKIPMLEVQASEGPKTEEEKWKALQDFIRRAFIDKVFLCYPPLIAHFRAAIQRQGNNHGMIPASVLSTFDNKVVLLCKQINGDVELNPSLSLILVLRAAELCNNDDVIVDGLWIGKRNPFTTVTKEKLINWIPESSNNLQDEAESSTNIEDKMESSKMIENEKEHSRNLETEAESSKTLDDEPKSKILQDEPESFKNLEEICLIVKDYWKRCLFRAVFIPCADDDAVKPLTIEVEPDEYYLDVIAALLSLKDSSHVVISRSVGKYSERVYFRFYPNVIDGNLHDLKENVRASCLSNQKIYGDAILASVGSTWGSKGTISCRDITLGNYYRMLLERVPESKYKLSRNALLVANFPDAFTTQSKWHGTSPHQLLQKFCQDNKLLNPDLNLIQINSYKEDHENNSGKQNGKSNGNSKDECYYQCNVKVFSKTQDLLLECGSKKAYKNQKDAFQHASFEALTHINKGIERVMLHMQSLNPFGGNKVPKISDETMLRTLPSGSLCCSQGFPNYFQGFTIDENHETDYDQILSSDIGESPGNGYQVVVQYAVYLVGSFGRECLESQDEFEFEIGTGSVIKQVERCITSMHVEDSKLFCVKIPHENVVLAAAPEKSETVSLLPLGECHLEYNIKLLKMIEPAEQRMEQAFFSPPLSKQRMEFALRLVLGSHAKSIVDLGCGSGSLFNTLLDQETGLEHVAGVDCSIKGFNRCVKVLDSKIGLQHKDKPSPTKLRTVLLYKGSIVDFDPRIRAPDLATCIEVIEHMPEAEAEKFGECALGMICPRILFVSTPNYEYNRLLQNGHSDGEQLVEDTESSLDLRRKFRNYDHKFEWTRKEFEDWAQKLADKYKYDVEFSGVGGYKEVEPGFASQMAIFKRQSELNTSYSDSIDKYIGIDDSTATGYEGYEVVWKWHKNRSVDVNI